MGLFRGSIVHQGGRARKQPIRRPSTMALSGCFPSFMGRFLSLMGRFPLLALMGRSPSWKFPSKKPIEKKAKSWDCLALLQGSFGPFDPKVAARVQNEFLEHLSQKIQNTEWPRFGSFTVWGWKGSTGSGFRFRRFLYQKGFSVFQYIFKGKDSSGSGSWKTVAAVPVPLAVSGQTVLTVPVSGSGSVPESPWKQSRKRVRFFKLFWTFWAKVGRKAPGTHFATFGWVQGPKWPLERAKAFCKPRSSWKLLQKAMSPDRQTSPNLHTKCAACMAKVKRLLERPGWLQRIWSTQWNARSGSSCTHASVHNCFEYLSTTPWSKTLLSQEKRLKQSFFKITNLTHSLSNKSLFPRNFDPEVLQSGVGVNVLANFRKIAPKFLSEFPQQMFILQIFCLVSQGFRHRPQNWHSSRISLCYSQFFHTDFQLVGETKRCGGVEIRMSSPRLVSGPVLSAFAAHHSAPEAPLMLRTKQSGKRRVTGIVTCCCYWQYRHCCCCHCCCHRCCHCCCCCCCCCCWLLLIAAAAAVADCCCCCCCCDHHRPCLHLMAEPDKSIKNCRISLPGPPPG